MELARFKPAVPKYSLMAMAGLLWTTVGLGLCRLGYKWVSLLPGTRAVSFGMAGVLLALIAYRYSFYGIGGKKHRTPQSFSGQRMSELIFSRDPRQRLICLSKAGYRVQRFALQAHAA